MPMEKEDGILILNLTIKSNRSPETYGKVTIWIKLFEFYKYYYNKYANKV